jgi:predicted lipoprotein with Yx(FWY)xxD motif
MVGGMSRASVTILIGGLLVLAGCGDEEQARTDAGAPKAADGRATATESMPNTRPARAPGVAITVAGSEFGPMLFDAKRQAIYVFENDRRDESVCYGECARAWPPVLTEGRPRASGGVRPALLGTLERRDGRRQVTYAGKPLYYYAHEEPGEVRCHNVDLNGGFWWVVGPNGERRP